MFALLSQRRLRWLGHVGHIERIPKEILYGELKRDLKAGNISPAGWVAIATDRSHWRLAVKAGTQAGEEKKERRRLREASQSYVRCNNCDRACRSRIGLYVQPQAGAATQPLTKSWRWFHCLPRQVDTDKSHFSNLFMNNCKTSSLCLCDPLFDTWMGRTQVHAVYL